MAGRCPWGDSLPYAVPLTPKGNLTLSDYLAQWHYMTLCDPHKTIELLAYFGFQNPLTQGVKVTPPRAFDRVKDKCSRTVLRCWILGAIGSGKSTLLHRLQQDAVPLSSACPSHSSAASTFSPFIKSVQTVDSEKFIVFEEINPNQMRSLLHNASKDFLSNKLDLLVLMYDAADPTSFAYLAGLTVDLTSFVCQFQVFMSF
jgi:mitochondrial Rho GTPase 1